MNKRQRAILVEFISVIAITAIAVVVMINLKDWVNRSEAIRAMNQLGQKVLEYQNQYRKNYLQEYGKEYPYATVPTEYYINSIKKSLEGWVRLGNLQYRARWIGLEATPDEVLAYTEKKYRSSLLSDGYVVLRLDGRVEWMGKQEFEKLLAQQQSEAEIEMMHK